MIFELTIFDFLFWLFSSPVLILAIALSIKLFLKKEGNIFSNILLACLLLASCFPLINNVLLLTDIKKQVPNLYFIPLDFSLFIGPLLYLYFKSKINPEFRWSIKYFIHFLIPICQISIYIIIGFRSVEFKLELLKNSILPIFFNIETTILIISILLYTYLSYLLLKRKDLIEKEWNKEIKQWLLVFINVFILLEISEVSFFIIEFVELGLFNKTHYQFNYLQILLELGLLIWFIIKAYEQYFPQIIFDSSTLKNIIAENTNSEITDLNVLMLEEKIYQNPDLNLSILSKKLGVSKRNTSNLIKDYYNKSFNEYINDFRLQEVIDRLNMKRYKELTIVGIAFEAGFSSKSTFYRCFVKRFDMTPSEYLIKSVETKLI